MRLFFGLFLVCAGSSGRMLGHDPSTPLRTQMGVREDAASRSSVCKPQGSPYKYGGRTRPRHRRGAAQGRDGQGRHRRRGTTGSSPLSVLFTRDCLASSLQAIEAQLRAQEANAIASQSLARQALEQKRLNQELYRREWFAEAARERYDAKTYQLRLQAQAAREPVPTPAGSAKVIQSGLRFVDFAHTRNHSIVNRAAPASSVPSAPAAAAVDRPLNPNNAAMVAAAPQSPTFSMPPAPAREARDRSPGPRFPPKPHEAPVAPQISSYGLAIHNEAAKARQQAKEAAEAAAVKQREEAKARRDRTKLAARQLAIERQSKVGPR